MSLEKLKTFYGHFIFIYCSKPQLKRKQGFTLIELLVTVLIAGGIITGLLYLTNELLTSDTRESNRTETQRDLQLALDFMSTEIKQALHVYTPTEWANVSALVTLPDHPNEATAPTPVLAFWKQQPLSQTIKEDCVNPRATVQERVACFSGHSYSLVIYAFSQNTSDDLWQGKGGILRYELVEDGSATSNYVSPVGQTLISFVRAAPDDDSGWPFEETNVTLPEPEILIDFVDYSAGAFTPPCSTGYEATPSATPAGGFYACINTRSSATAAGFGNQDVVLFLHGNAKGRSGLMTDTSFLPSLEARVFSRGLLEGN
ncbi:MAG: type II secretion system protein [Cyanobacteria bacterium P01_F01_bin.150]